MRRRMWPVYCRSAQRRPGREPRRHPSRTSGARSRSSPLNEGRGANPGDTLAGPALRVEQRRSTKAGARTPATRPAQRQSTFRPARAQRRPGREPRRHTCACRRTRAWRGPLNEGRGANPGDTRDRLARRRGGAGRSTKAGARTPATRGGGEQEPDPVHAQRRPGREPRRHRPSEPGPDPAYLRSTKAGARTPATLDGCRKQLPPRAAQRRPGREPRRHYTTRDWMRFAEAAQRRPGREPRRHRDGRDGDLALVLIALNEGRGANPGDTPDFHRGVVRAGRSTKAGARTPATRPWPRRLAAAAPRSTKAGARTPATRTRADSGSTATRSLNEGRGANPGDTLVRFLPRWDCQNAQRRPGREPRRHGGGRA